MTIRPGIVQSFDGTAYTAAVQMTGSLAVWLADVPVARNIASGELIAGRRCAVLFFDEGTARDSVLIAVYT